MSAIRRQGGGWTVIQQRQQRGGGGVWVSFGLEASGLFCVLEVATRQDLCWSSYKRVKGKATLQHALTQTPCSQPAINVLTCTASLNN